MITAVEIANFKGIGARQRIELRPLTLLFGANSAGKSSILHAIQYAAEVFESRNLNAGAIGDGPAGVDLGGFHTFVHGRDSNQDVSLAFEVDLNARVLPSYPTSTPSNVDDPETLFHVPQTACVEVAIGWSNLLQRAFVRRYAVAMNGVELAELLYEPGSPEFELALYENHPIFVRGAEHSSIAQWHPLSMYELEDQDTTVIRHLLSWACHTRAFFAMVPERAPYTTSIGLIGQQDAFPDLDRMLSTESDFESIPSDATIAPSDSVALADYLNAAISTLVLGPGKLIRDQLVKSRFLGPIREVPARNHVMIRQSERSRWSSGLGAWDHLESADEKFVDSVSQWLGDEDRLDSGYRLRLKRFKELDLSDPLVVKLMSGRAFDEVESDARLSLDKIPTQSRLLIVPTDESIEFRPNDVGIGISQVIPVIVTALQGEGRSIAIEQPELHIHPRLQAAIADLFIESSQQRRHRFLIETHSEHFILRLQRRIREATQGAGTPGRLLSSDDVVIYHVSQDDSHTQVRRIDVDKNGDFIQPWPDDFFEIDFYERFGDAR